MEKLCDKTVEVKELKQSTYWTRLVVRVTKVTALLVALPLAGASAVKEVVQSNSQSAMNLQHKADVVDATMKGLPPVAVSGAAAAGVQINEVIMWATLVYLILQIGFLLYKWIRLHNETRKTEDKE
jgi:hypothetical protein